MKTEQRAASETPGRPRAVTALQKKEGRANRLGAAVPPTSEPGSVERSVIEEARSCRMRPVQRVFSRADTGGGWLHSTAGLRLHGVFWMLADRSACGVQQPRLAGGVTAKHVRMGSCGATQGVAQSRVPACRDAFFADGAVPDARGDLAPAQGTLPCRRQPRVHGACRSQDPHVRSSLQTRRLVCVRDGSDRTLGRWLATTTQQPERAGQCRQNEQRRSV